MKISNAFGALVLLVNRESVSSEALAKEVGIGDASVEPMVVGMKKAGIPVRNKNEEGLRYYFLAKTDVDRLFAPAWREIFDVVDSRYLNPSDRLMILLQAFGPIGVMPCEEK